MSQESDHKDTERRNREATRLNPEKSGIRSGNPQLDPDHARKQPAGAGKGEEKLHEHRPLSGRS